jgi:hypothetical protein
MEEAEAEPVDPEPRAPRGLRGRALLAIATVLLALPIAATAGAAEPVTIGEWMRAIFVTPDREIDTSQEGVAAAPAPLPAPTAQASTQPTPPRAPVARADVAPFGLPRDSARRKRRR